MSATTRDVSSRSTATTGDIAWSYTTGGTISGAVPVANNVAYASADGKLFALNSHQWSIVWTASIGAISEFTSPTISNNLVYIGNDGGQLSARRTNNGSEHGTSRRGPDIWQASGGK